jgi:hypothetical protein
VSGIGKSGHKARFCPAPPFDGTHFDTNCPNSLNESHHQVIHAGGMFCFQCELPNLLQESMPPDPEMVDLIEWAFLEGQIDSLEAELAYMWLKAKSTN